MTYTCPVCGYNRLDEPPTRYEICPSCGTEFGNHDFFETHAQLRGKWIAAGAKWWDDEAYKPPDFDPIAQLGNIRYQVTNADRIAMASSDIAISGNLGLPEPNVTYQTDLAQSGASPMIVLRIKPGAPNIRAFSQGAPSDRQPSPVFRLA